MNGIIIFVALALMADLIGLTVYKIGHGSACCGKVEAPEKKIKARDKNRKHYPYAYVARIEGMICTNCARRVENIFHTQPEILAKVVLGEKLAYVYSKRPISRDDVLRYLQGTPYTLLEFCKEEEK